MTTVTAANQFAAIQTEEALELALYDAMVALNDGVEYDDVIELDNDIKAKNPVAHKILCDDYRDRYDEIFLASLED